MLLSLNRPVNGNTVPWYYAQNRHTAGHIPLERQTADTDATSVSTNDEHRRLISRMSATPVPPDRHKAKHCNIHILCWRTCTLWSRTAQHFSLTDKMRSSWLHVFSGELRTLPRLQRIRKTYSFNRQFLGYESGYNNWKHYSFTPNKLVALPKYWRHQSVPGADQGGGSGRGTAELWLRLMIGERRRFSASQNLSYSVSTFFMARHLFIQNTQNISGCIT